MPSLTPAQLSLELRVPQKRIRDVLRQLYGTLPDDQPRWQLDENQAERVRTHFDKTAADPLEAWLLEPGDVVRRRSIHETYGGQQQGGISTPRSIPEILIFTDPDAGAKFGYNQFEGLREDGSYSYTGEGQYGPQVFVRGNKAVRDAAKDGKIIRLLRTKGILATYVGAFTTGDPAFTIETIPDADGDPRDGIIFNLLPLDALIELLPAYGGQLGPTGDLTNYAATPRIWTPPEFSDVVVPETKHVQDERTVSRVEFELQADFGVWLGSQGATPKRLPLRAGSTLIEPDMFVPERNWIVEAKRSTARGHVRTAIGQVLDYVHIAAKAGLLAAPVILLPGTPELDLQELMHELGITLATRTSDGFRILDPKPSQT
ncbi:hypothetical protein [Microbacterium oleivorans]|uniref:ScoMcrA-like SRA domain-containing protein n=1 Tax=Microbacterium oleivorans TaxID=273677 RepID=A0A7D5IQE1_9MICO|nr:hypothetical protein [Microbacterium oleivorans]QLD11661.1 hypothetical protein HW566_07695 [Microbacterium oleivorans]